MSNQITLPMSSELFRGLNAYLYEAKQLTNPQLGMGEQFQLKYQSPIGGIEAVCHWDGVCLFATITKKPFLVPVETIRLRVASLIQEWVTKQPTTPAPTVPTTPTNPAA